jgi:hypothetical protein
MAIGWLTPGCGWVVQLEPEASHSEPDHLELGGAEWLNCVRGWDLVAAAAADSEVRFVEAALVEEAGSVEVAVL